MVLFLLKAREQKQKAWQSKCWARTLRTLREPPFLGAEKTNLAFSKNLILPGFEAGRGKEWHLLGTSFTSTESHTIKWHIPKTANRSAHTILVCIFKSQSKASI